MMSAIPSIPSVSEQNSAGWVGHSENPSGEDNRVHVLCCARGPLSVVARVSLELTVHLIPPIGSSSRIDWKWLNQQQHIFVSHTNWRR
jgi:hypothetical protein